MAFEEVYRNRRVLVTGHNGFIGSWISLWLHELGADIHGVGLAPENSPNHLGVLGLPIKEHLKDIRDSDSLVSVITATQPEFIVHNAAQTSSLKSYRDPQATWMTNVMGTINLLEACRNAGTVKAILVVNSNLGFEKYPVDFSPTEHLAGEELQRASETSKDIVVQSFRRAYFGQQERPLLASARTANLIGGGDWSEDRLIPDVVRSVAVRQPFEVRNPHTVQSWLHVLDFVAGCLRIGHQLLNGNRRFVGTWDFGPDEDGYCTVMELLDKMKLHWPEIQCNVSEQAQTQRSSPFAVDSNNARGELGWAPIWSLEQTLSQTAIWYRDFVSGSRLQSVDQLHSYLRDMQQNAVGSEKS